MLKATTEHWKLAEGLIIILIVLALPNGVRDLLKMVFKPSDDLAQGGTKAKPVTEAGHG